ncbi:MAG: methyltransferase domain-containing protein [Candidatus Diapherotrites archaeon]|nr:methyltransferase domain-containing protein [Candidatus Diapherotrites archaeon]
MPRKRYLKTHVNERRNLGKNTRNSWASFLRAIRASNPLFFESHLKEIEQGLAFDLGRHIIEIARNSKTPVSVMDLGCGIPNALLDLEKLFSKEKVNVKMVGINSFRIPNRISDKVRVIPFHKLSEKFPSNSQDLVFSHHGFTNVLQFGGTEYIKQTLSEVLKILKPNGLFVFNVPKKREVNGKIINPIKINFFEFKDLFTKAGFEIETEKNFEQRISIQNSSDNVGEYEEVTISGFAFVLKKPARKK